MAQLDTVAKVAAWMRRKIDDPGLVGYPYSAQADDLALGFEEFRGYCPPEVFETHFDPPTLTGASQVNLASILFGPPPAQWTALTAYALGASVTNASRVYYCTVAGTSGAAPGPTGTGTAIVDGTVTWRFTPQGTRLSRVTQVDATGTLLTVFRAASSFETLRQSPARSIASVNNVYTGTRWWLDGRVLRFNVAITGLVQIWYVPLNEIDWPTAIAPNTNVFLSDLIQFHDLVALFAARHYMLKQGESSEVLDSQIDRRVAKLEAYFSETRSGDGSRWVDEGRW